MNKRLRILLLVRLLSDELGLCLSLVLLRASWDIYSFLTRDRLMNRLHAHLASVRWQYDWRATGWLNDWIRMLRYVVSYHAAWIVDDDLLFLLYHYGMFFCFSCFIIYNLVEIYFLIKVFFFIWIYWSLQFNIILLKIY